MKFDLEDPDLWHLVQALLASCQSDFGEITFLDNPITFSNFPKIPIRPPVFFGKDKPHW